MNTLQIIEKVKEEFDLKDDSLGVIFNAMAEKIFRLENHINFLNKRFSQQYKPKFSDKDDLFFGYYTRFKI